MTAFITGLILGAVAMLDALLILATGYLEGVRNGKKGRSAEGAEKGK